MAKRKKSKIVVRPWCWYCEREFEDEKVLMQHQKAKHFKCHQCPRRLNTAGGLAVHIQQVHKLDPDQLPRIDNALPGRDGYEVEIFGMEGIPAPDVADYKRRKEIELGLPPGSISGSGKGQQQNKRARIENRVLTEEELRIQLEAHKALMGAGDQPASGAPAAPGTAVYNAAPQTYAAPPVPAAVPPAPFMPGMPPPGVPGAPPFPGPPPPGMPFPPFPPGALPPGVPPPGFPVPPPGLLRPGAPGAPPLPPGIPMPPFPPGSGPLLHGGSASPPVAGPTPPFPGTPGVAPPPPPGGAPPAQVAPARPLATPNPAQMNPPLKAGTVLVWQDANYSPVEQRANHDKYRFDPSKAGPPPPPSQGGQTAAASEDSPSKDGPRGTKRARAEDFM